MVAVEQEGAGDGHDALPNLERLPDAGIDHRLVEHERDRRVHVVPRLGEGRTHDARRTRLEHYGERRRVIEANHGFRVGVEHIDQTNDHRLGDRILDLEPNLACTIKEDRR